MNLHDLVLDFSDVVLLKKLYNIILNKHIDNVIHGDRIKSARHEPAICLKSLFITFISKTATNTIINIIKLLTNNIN